jgi:DNA-binding response OmpR family regulator
MNTKVLVIDDDSAIREGLALMLSSGGYDVRVATSTSNLEAIIDEWRPALIVLDVMLSGEDGRDATRRLKGLDAAIHAQIRRWLRTFSREIVPFGSSFAISPFSIT